MQQARQLRRVHAEHRHHWAARCSRGHEALVVVHAQVVLQPHLLLGVHGDAAMMARANTLT